MKSRAYVIYLFFIFILLAMLQADFLHSLSFFNARPDFLLILSAVTAFYTGGSFTLPAVCSFLAALCCSAFSDGSPAFFVCIYTAAAYIGYFIRDRRFASSFYAPYAVTAAACIVALTGYIIFFAITGDHVLVPEIIKTAPAYIVINIVFAFPIICIVKIFAAPRDPFFGFK